ncbi:hypothetical protein LIER_29045 [Lithospermum erythrorhizon]|uniref:Uncharacterized protein n=1 Tax=Lithospermum erythrorhizon TaxID=34254 RepID=A0AAV3RMV2_LITER
MVTFETSPGREFSTLCIVGSEEDKVTTLVAHTPLYRVCATKWPSFRSSNSERSCNWSSVQEKVLHLEGSDQESPVPPCGFHFLDVLDCYRAMLASAFCENGCPSTNTLIIPQRELSISLWDLLELGSLSMTGPSFDEVVPTTECLSQSLNDKARILVSCRFLLSGYHYLSDQSPDGSVSISAWNHSLRSSIGYKAADRSTSKVACPRKSAVVDLRPWYSTDRHPFDVLRVGVDLDEEAYCAAFLVC